MIESIKAKRILYCENTGFGGGSTVSLKVLSKGLDRSRYQPIFMFGDNGNKGHWKDEEVHEIHGSSLDNFDFAPPVSSIVWWYRFFRFLLFGSLELIYLPICLRRLKPDLVHINGGQSLVLGIVCRMLGIPVVWHIRELVRMNFLGRIQDRIYASCSGQIIAISDAVRKRLPISDKRGKIVVIYNAADLSVTAKQSLDSVRSMWGCSEDDFVVLLLGTVNYQKGYGFLADVARETKSNIKIKYVLAGKIEDSDAGLLRSILRICYRRMKGGSGKLRLEREQILERWKSTVEHGQAVFPGRVDSVSALGAADVVVCPNQCTEPFGRTVVEAYAQGVPVVAMNVNAFDETVRSGVTGYLLENDPDQWAKTLLGMSNNPDNMRTFSKNAKAESLRYDASIHVRKVQELYDQILG